VQYPDDPVPNPSNIRIEELLASDDAPESAPPVREGLPRSFRMRADKHYVEMLDAPAPRPAAAATAAADDTTAAVKTDKTSDPIDHAAVAASAVASSEAAQALAALRTCTSLLSDRGPALPSTVAANVIRAEVWRATCLLHASRFLRGEVVPLLKPVRAHAVIDQVVKSIEPERRLRGVTIDDRINLGESRIVVDEQLLVSALSGLLMATISLTEEGSDLVVSISAESHGNEIVFAMAQDLASAPPEWATQSVAVVAATRIVVACEGRMTAKGTVRGTDVRVVIPKAR
jgi:hypothetical protein